MTPAAPDIKDDGPENKDLVERDFEPIDLEEVEIEPGQLRETAAEQVRDFDARGMDLAHNVAENLEKPLDDEVIRDLRTLAKEAADALRLFVEKTVELEQKTGFCLTAVTLCAQQMYL